MTAIPIERKHGKKRMEVKEEGKKPRKGKLKVKVKQVNPHSQISGPDVHYYAKLPGTCKEIL